MPLAPAVDVALRTNLSLRGPKETHTSHCVRLGEKKSQSVCGVGSINVCKLAASVRANGSNCRSIQRSVAIYSSNSSETFSV